MQNNMLDLLILIVVIALAAIVFFYMFADLVRQCVRMNRADKQGGDIKLRKIRKNGALQSVDKSGGEDAAVLPKDFEREQ